MFLLKEMDKTFGFAILLLHLISISFLSFTRLSLIETLSVFRDLKPGISSNLIRHQSRRREAMFVLSISGWCPLCDRRHRVTSRKANQPLSPTPCHLADAVASAYKPIRRVAATPAFQREQTHTWQVWVTAARSAWTPSRRSWVTGTSLAQQCN